MRPTSLNSISLLASTLLLSLAACSGSTAGTDGGSCSDSSCATDSGPGFPYGGCQATFSDDFSDSTFADAGCSSLTGLPDSGYASDAGPDWILGLTVFSSAVQSNEVVQIDLGSAPSPGIYAAENVSNWSAVCVSHTICEFVSGNEAVPEESFTLTISSVFDLDGGAGRAHGTFSGTQYVEASAGSFCGTSSHETVTIDF